MKEQTTNKITIRTMTLDDLEGGMRLSKAEGWNQTENDWLLFITNPNNICLLAESDHQIVGTTTSINYGNTEAWIGMVLVDKNYRGQGISKALLSQIFDKLSSVNCLKLDATAAGQPVYQKFGFKNEYLISRMVNLSVKDVPVQDSDSNIETLNEHDLDEVIALDQEVFGANRKQLFQFMFKEYPTAASILKRHGKVVGFVLGREGSRYFQIGPVVAASEVDAKHLISRSLMKMANRAVVLDVLCSKKILIEWLDTIGFNTQRDFIRMYKEENPFPGKVDMLYCSCGPEFG